MFGNINIYPQKEETPFKPRSIYGITKVSGYQMSQHYREKYKPPPIKISEKMNIKKEYIIASFTLLCLILRD